MTLPFAIALCLLIGLVYTVGWYLVALRFDRLVDDLSDGGGYSGDMWA